MRRNHKKVTDDTNNRKRNIQLIAAVTATVLAVVSGSTFAWFSWKDGLNATAKIKSPSDIMLMAGNCEDISRLNLGNIDIKEIEEGTVSSGTGDNTVYTRQYVFSVGCEYDTFSSQREYYIQLAYTTNIDFEYNIYRAQYVAPKSGSAYTTDEISSAKSSGDMAVYEGEDGTQYIYRKVDSYTSTDNTDGTADDEDDENDVEAGNGDDGENENAEVSESAVQPITLTTYKTSENQDGNKTYKEYNSVQEFAQPVYKVSNKITEHDNDVGDNANSAENAYTANGSTWNFVDYYILEIQWTKQYSDNTSSRYKESDMVYLLADSGD